MSEEYNEADEERVASYVERLLNDTIVARMQVHPVGSSAAIWAARDGIDYVCKGDDRVTLKWRGPRKGVVTFHRTRIDFEIPAELPEAAR